jgi:cytochrome P450
MSHSPAAAASGRPEIDGAVFNPYAKDFIRDPHPAWQRLIRDFPLVWHKDLQMWLVNSHALCDEVLKDSRFTPNFRVWELAPPPKAEADKTDFDLAYEKGFFAVSTKDHLRLRRLTLPAFSRPVMAKIEAKIRDLVVECFDALGGAGRFDVYEAIASKLPVRAISRMVGVPTDREEFFHEFAVNIIKATRINISAREREAAVELTKPGFAYFKEQIAQRRTLPHPGEDFLGSLVGASDNGERLDDYEILSVVFALITAGSDTATDLHTFAIHGLLSNLKQYELLKRQPQLMENAIIELLRYGSFGKIPFFRFASEDIDFHGQTIRRGQAVGVNISCAWNDPAKYPDWNQLDLQRRLDGNLVFGAGAHFCIGTYLVRVQGGLMLSEFIRRYPEAELLDGTGELDYDYRHHNARRINRLVVRTNRVSLQQAA